MSQATRTRHLRESRDKAGGDKNKALFFFFSTRLVASYVGVFSEHIKFCMQSTAMLIVHHCSILLAEFNTSTFHFC